VVRRRTASQRAEGFALHRCVARDRRELPGRLLGSSTILVSVADDVIASVAMNLQEWRGEELRGKSVYSHEWGVGCQAAAAVRGLRRGLLPCTPCRRSAAVGVPPWRGRYSPLKRRVICGARGTRDRARGWEELRGASRPPGAAVSRRGGILRQDTCVRWKRPECRC